MKKLLLVLLIGLIGFSSCKKDDDPTPGGCGTVMDYRSSLDDNLNTTYFLLINFDNGSTGSVEVDRTTYLGHNIGDNICL